MSRAKVGQRRSPDHLHRKVGPAVGGRSGVQDTGDAGVIHHGKRLALALETSQDRLGVHSRLDQLQGDFPSDGLELARAVDAAVAAFAEQFDQPLRSHHLLQDR